MLSPLLHIRDKPDDITIRPAEVRHALQCLSYVEMVPQQSIVTGFIPLQGKSTTRLLLSTSRY